MILDVSQLPEPQQVTESDPERIKAMIASQYQPMVMKGIAREWPIVQKAQQSDAAALSYLSSYAGNDEHNLVRLDKAHKGRMFYANDSLTEFNFHTEQVTVADGIEIMKQGLTDTSLPSACFQCVPVRKAFPSLVDQLRIPIVQSNASGFVWLGSEFTVAPHFDEAQNIAIVAAGSRRFTLFPPEQVNNLYVGPVENTPAGQPISLVNLREPDLKAHPRYALAYEHGMSVVLHPGDAIYIPSPWWHHVESLSGFNLLVNYWWSDNKTSTQLPFPALMHALQAFNDMKPAERAAWKVFMEHYVFSEDDGRFKHIPDEAKGVLGQDKQDKSVFIHNWLARQLR